MFAKTLVRTLPMLLAVVASFIYAIVKWIKTKHGATVWLLIAFVVPAVYVALLNSFFPYHYYLFVFPLSIFMWNLTEENKFSKKGTVIFYSIFGVILALFVAFGSAVSPASIRFIKAEQKVQAKNKKNIEKIKGGQNKILYFDSGLGAYILGNDSFSKYYYPLPIQRRKVAEEKQEAYHHMIRDIEKYNGRYITYEKSYMEKNNSIIRNDKVVSELLKKYNHKVTTLYYAPNIDISPLRESDLVNSIDVYEKAINDK